MGMIRKRFRKLCGRLERGVWERSNLTEYIAFYSQYWKYIIPGSFDDSAELRLIQATPNHQRATVRADFMNRQDLEPRIHPFPDHRLWRDLNPEQLIEWVGILQSGRIILKQETSDRILRVPFVSQNSEQAAAVSFCEELEFSEEDAAWPIHRILHNLRNENNFTPSYNLNPWAQKQMKLIFELKLPQTHRYYRRVANCHRLVRAVPSVPEMNLSQLAQVLTTLTGRISGNGWEASSAKVQPTENLLQEVNHCIRYLSSMPPNGTTTSYGIKHDVEEDAGYISNTAALVALFYLGYGHQWLWNPQPRRRQSINQTPSPVPLAEAEPFYV